MPPARSGALACLATLCVLACDSYAPEPPARGIFSSCCAGAGTCVPLTAVSSGDAMRLGQDSCDEALLCAPTPLVESPAFVPESCRSLGQREGRCLPGCLPEVASRAEQLRRDGCAEAQLCVPCFDPVSSEETGACAIAKDPGPREPAAPFADCCAARARCVPEAIIAPDLRLRLATDGCQPGSATLCVPEVWVETADSRPASCRAHADAEGRCLAECLPAVISRADQLRVDSCEPGQRCVPCFDPVTGEATNACTINGDAPSEEPRVFDGCCGELGLCVPAEAVSPEDRSRLAADSCEPGGAALCAPRAWLKEPRELPEHCRAHGDAEGRCLPNCLPEVAEQAERLRKDRCENGASCVPCFDPISGEDTGACTIGSDPGPSEPPVLFGSCCGGHARCVPREVVAEASRARLGADGCDGAADALCVPSPWLAAPAQPPRRCRAHDDAEGRCLLSCLPELLGRLGRLRRDACEQDERCVPCFDPLSGESSGACSIAHDPGPSEPPKLFAQCCGELGACVPSEALDEDDRARLAKAECMGEAMCAPKAWVRDERAAPTTCRSYGGAEGRCLPACLPDVARRADRLPRASCPEAQLCVPCFDPITQENTGACNIGPDPGPEELPASFNECCGGVGRCVPIAALHENERGRLDRNSCDQAEPALCAPTDWVRHDRFVPATCSAPGEVEGRCLPDCLPELATRRQQLVAGGCAPHHLCVPCFDPLTGEDTSACRLGDDVPAAPAKLYASCCGDAGVCVPSELVSSTDRPRLDAEGCGQAPNSALCAPRAWIVGAQMAPRRCRAHADAEGRCLPGCLPEVAAQRDKLRRDDCAPSELCVPCYDPVDGRDTQACHVAADAGPTEPARLFASCCGERGRCVPSQLVAPDQRAQLVADNCSGGEQLCAPGEWLSDPPRALPKCQGHLGAEGRCLPDCLPQVSAQRARLLQDSCPADTACVPCYDPLSGADTQACTQPGDTGPSQPKQTFALCCGDTGRCIPSSLVSESDRSRLGKDSCKDPNDALCVPSPWLADDRKPPESCRAPGDLEARCLPSCLPDVQRRGSTLRKSTCSDLQSCVPCYDPLSGEDTGACSIAGDAPEEPAATYPSCCGGSGTCLPGELLSSTSGLAGEACGTGGTYCVPAAAAEGRDPGFAACSLLGISAACVPRCFIDPSQGQSAPQVSCGAGMACVPCDRLSVRTAVCGQ